MVKIHDAIAIEPQNSRCHCYDDAKLGGEKMLCIHKIVLGTYRYSLVRLHFQHIMEAFHSLPYLWVGVISILPHSAPSWVLS